MSEDRKSDLEGLAESGTDGQTQADDMNRPDEEAVMTDATGSEPEQSDEQPIPDEESRAEDAADPSEYDASRERLDDAGEDTVDEVPDETAQDESAREGAAVDEPDESHQDDPAGEVAVTGERDESEPAEDADNSGSVPMESEAATGDEGEPGEEDVPHEMTFTEHLNELRVRLVRCIIAAFVGLLICYPFAEELFRVLMNPLIVLLEPAGGSLIYTGLPEAFFTHLKVAAIAGMFAASPYIFYQLWMFIAPGLYEGERKYIIPIAFFSAAFFVTGALFGYFVVFPFGFDFFLGYASDIIKPMPSVREYFSFSTSMLFAFGLIFELPLFIFFLSIMGIVTHVSLRKFQKFAVLGSFVVSAVLTPPDVVSQCFMAGPLCLLYEVGIWVAYVFGKKPKKAPVDEEEQAEA